MSDQKTLYAMPLLPKHTPCTCANKANCKSAAAKKIKSAKFRNFKKTYDRDYVGKYCLVDWLDDSAVIDCSLIHEWD